MKTNDVRLVKPGYEPANKPVDVAFQGVRALNILFWPGFIVDYATGDMDKVNPTLSFQLSKKDIS